MVRAPVPRSIGKRSVMATKNGVASQNGTQYSSSSSTSFIHRIGRPYERSPTMFWETKIEATASQSTPYRSARRAGDRVASCNVVVAAMVFAMLVGPVALGNGAVTDGPRAGKCGSGD